ncbi:MAG TPA: SDR family NAD(P)-dependent oxidoreductase [Geminicoccus sp.]|uniref:type I polyketide synthase n=1 Tax=Geminicoccus sp. TaxID=2024832 RepID=UPI002C09F791|nr:SDR family NAD(P)-dependent oxidoreductase [Geminicoccus sp.]HWL69678.1 SDR family NAD(P)-dependent oxidoreductase [Geminicoccus sp.]
MNDSLNERLKESIRAIAALRAKVQQLEAQRPGSERGTPIAVTGMACRMPGARDLDGFWQNLLDGVDSVGPVPADRWDGAAWHDPDPDAPGRIGYREAAFLDGIDRFDAELFGISPAEAVSMDPQQRLLLEVAWHALEDAGLAPDRLQRRPVGVFLGLNSTDHLLSALADPDAVDPHMLSGAVASVAAGRLAFVLGLTGPALVVDTACSSSLVAAQLAVESLRRGECDIAIVGGAHLLLEPHVPVALSRARMLAPDGRCKPFGEGADGFGQGEGCGVVVLKRLNDAEAAGDRVRAVIQGAAVNQDGRSAGLTAPSGRAQEAVIRAALADAGLEPAAVDAIEAHGTGTGLGDPVEMHALARVFRERDRPLWVGSLKGNVGHLAAGAGIAGLIKAVLMVEHGTVPSSLHCRRLNPHIELDGADLRVPGSLMPVPLRAVGVSSFGFSGTNAHLVVAPAPVARNEPGIPENHRPQLLISAHTPQALQELAAAYRERLAQAPDSFRDLCHSAAAGRARLPWWICVANPDELATAVPRQGGHPEIGPQPGRRVVLPLTPLQGQAFPARRSHALPAPAALPGRFIDSPSADRQLETVLDLARLPWLADHQVAGRIVVPGAVLLTLMAAAAPSDRPHLADIHFIEPVVLDGPVRLVTLARPDGEITVTSRGGASWITHAQATASVIAAAPRTERPAAGTALSREAWRTALAGRGITIGPAFQAIQRMERADGRAEAMLERPDGLRPDGVPLHPALLDAALQVAGGTLEGEATLLPVGIGRVSLLGAADGPLRATATRREGGDESAIDIVLESAGRPVALVEAMQVREVAVTAPPDWLAGIVWETAPEPALQAARPATLVRVGEAGLPPAAALGELRRLAALPSPPRVCLVIRSTASDPTAGAAVGLASALRQERPELDLRCIETVGKVADEAIAAEAARPDGEPWIRLTTARRERPRLVKLPVPVAPPADLSGTVLITGGFGGIGRAMAGWAFARGATALVLVGRHPAPLPPMPVPVVPLALDVAAADAAAVMAAALNGLPPLDAIIHAAGIRGDALLDELTPEQLDAVLAPKLAGALALHELSRRHPVRHFLLFGSIASFIGAAGQAAYAAANAALDAFAAFREAKGQPAKVIDWGRWEGEGMVATLSPAQQARIDRRGILPMPVAQALAALDAAIARPEARIVLAAFDRALLAAADPPPLLQRYLDEVPAQEAPGDDVASIVARVLGRPVEPDRPLTAYGLDSLMAVDLRNRLNRRFGASLQLADILSGIDLAGLDRRLAELADDEVEVLTL